MRYYRLDLMNAKTGKPIYASSMGGKPITSLTEDGRHNPGALNIEFNISTVEYTPAKGSNQDAFMRVWGLGIRDISAALDLSPDLKLGHTVDVNFFAGMSKGLPLANPKQQGLIFSGGIVQTWGNWIGTDQTLDFVFGARWGTAAQEGAHSPDSFPFFWKKGTPLKIAIAQTLGVAVPALKQTINISDKLVVNHDVPGMYQSMTEFTTFIHEMSRSILSGDPTYPGVHITTDGKNVYVFDIVTPTSKADKPIKIDFQDMIGQPTWIGSTTITVKLVLRADIHSSDYITLPKAAMTETQAGQAYLRDKTSFSGKYFVKEIEHFGNFRQPDAASWNTTIIATVVPKDVK